MSYRSFIMRETASARSNLITLLFAILAMSIVLMGSAINSMAESEPFTPGINDKAPTMRLEGTYTFTATPSTAGGTISWTVDRSVNYTITPSVYTATGTSVAFELDWSKGNTTYIIKAEDNGFDDEFQVQVFPPDKGIRYQFKNPYRPSPDIKIRVQVPGGLNLNSPLISVHHGSSRANYFSYWTNWGKNQDWIILAPHFPDSGKWAGSRGYNLGNMFTGNDGTGKLNPTEQWSYRIAVDAAVAFLEGFDLNDQTFDIWGHSAGGQFSHRTSMFIRDAPIRRCLPANPGWWTLPVYDETESNYRYPYGIFHPKLDYGPADIERFMNTPGVINAGNRDTKRDSGLRITPEADAQGRNRWLRANNMFRVINAQSPYNNWDFFEVDGIGHDGQAMAWAAQDWLVDNPPDIGPTASFIATPFSGNAPLEVGFDASASHAPQGGTIVSYEWDFGDSSTGMDVMTSHRYDNPGTYSATLTVTDDSAETATVSTVITVTVKVAE